MRGRRYRAVRARGRMADLSPRFSMSPPDLALFLVLAAVAAYVQTVTGFAFGLIMMGGVALVHLLPLPDAAALVSALTLANALQMMVKGWRHIAWREWRLSLLASLPMIFVGFALLQWLASEHVALLRAILAAAILFASLAVLRPPRPGARQPHPATYVAAGLASGLMSGLFSAGGPPLVFRFYTAPLPLPTIRETLVSIYALNAILRLVIVFGSHHRPPATLWWGLLAVPVVMAVTAAARRWPPSLSPAALRGSVVALLAASALAIGLPALPQLFP